MASDGGTRDDPSPPAAISRPPRADGPDPGLARPRASACEEFLDLYEAHYTKVVRFVILACSATKEAAEEAAQEAFVEAWQKASKPGDWEKVDQPLAWLRSVAQRRYRRPGGIRRDRPPTVTGVPLEDLLDLSTRRPGPDELATVAVDLLNALCSLPGDDLRAVMAFTLDGFPDSVIAAQLGMDPQRVRNLRAKARRLLIPSLPGYLREGGSR
ncbi:hypothetical protein GCM10009550_18430 [Actinocorallia libanotica]|uniref:RNA polymerase sigma-70 region 2 domain-containing protein n=2 Tax=Actinocorallia libanotica TaxID=46162 RepID=A0ABN1QMZ6_9ACTN